MLAIIFIIMVIIVNRILSQSLTEQQPTGNLIWESITMQKFPSHFS